MIIPFATQSYKHDSLPISSQRAVNVYAEREPPDAKTQVAVLEAPGLISFATCGSGPIRGMHVMAGVLYAVSGTSLYSVTSAGVATAVGGAVSGTNLVSMADNGTQLCIVNGVNGYIYSVAGGFQLITDADFVAARTVEFFDSYFVFDRINSNRFAISALLDGTSFDPLDFASAEASPDNVLTTLNQMEALLIFGETTIELWQNTGAVNFPFQRVPGGLIERGCAAALTPVKEDNSVFFLGNDRVFYRLQGVQPIRVSTHAIETAWQKYATISDAFCFAWTWEGHKFIVLTFPTALATWVYDVSSGLWHERVSWDENNNTVLRWRPSSHASVYNKQLFGDSLSGKIGYADADTFTEFGNTMQALAVAPAIQQDAKRVFMSRFELLMETGVGTATGQGSDPQIMLDWSDDGGATFASPQQWRSLGAMGKRRTRVRWTRLGSFFDRRLRITITDPVRRKIIAASAELRQGM